jgi:hypothetical protein
MKTYKWRNSNNITCNWLSTNLHYTTRRIQIFVIKTCPLQFFKTIRKVFPICNLQVFSLQLFNYQKQTTKHREQNIDLADHQESSFMMKALQSSFQLITVRAFFCCLTDDACIADILFQDAEGNDYTRWHCCRVQMCDLLSQWDFSLFTSTIQEKDL